MSERWAVICGVVRDPAAMALKLSHLSEWRSRGSIDGVVFSTWHGELDRYPEIRQQLAELSAIVVELEPPLLKTVGHYVHQAKTLFYGLQAVPDGAMVLKLRPDIAPLNDHVERAVLTTDLTIPADDRWPPIFQSRILLAASFIETPYYLNDIIFYGLREDLILLANFDLTTEFLCSSTAPEQFFFRPPFARHFPIIEAYLQIYPTFVFDDPELSKSRLDTLLDSDFFLECWALNVQVMDRYFRLGLIGETDREPVPSSIEISVGDVARGLAPGTSFHQGAQTVIGQDERPLSILRDGLYSDDALGRRFRAAFERVSDPAYRSGFKANPLTPAPEVVALRDALARCMPGLPHRQDARRAPQDRRFLVRGESDRVGLTVQTDEVRRLEEQINHLRRLIDDLRASEPSPA